MKQIQELFLKRVDRSGECWLWNFGTDRDGYGKIKLFGKHLRAHRVSYELFVGEIPPGQRVLHKCDRPRCVRPDHFFLGTPKENTHDCILKGRFTRRPGARLTPEQVNNIRAKYKPHQYTQAMIAEEYGISRSYVGLVLNGKRLTN